MPNELNNTKVKKQPATEPIEQEVPVIPTGTPQQPQAIPIQSIPSGMPMSWYTAMGLTPEMLSQMGVTPKIEYRPPPVQPSFPGRPTTYPGYGQQYPSGQSQPYVRPPQGQPNVQPSMPQGPPPGVSQGPTPGQPGAVGPTPGQPQYPGYSSQGYPVMQPSGAAGGIGDLVCGTRAKIWTTVNGGLTNMPFPISIVHLVGMIREAMLTIEATWVNDQLSGVRKMTQGGMPPAQGGGFLGKMFGGMFGGGGQGGGLLSGLRQQTQPMTQYPQAQSMPQWKSQEQPRMF